MILYHNHPEYRIGDEIQTTAMLKYFRQQGYQFHYTDSNPWISALSLFPDNLVTFVSDNFENHEYFDPLDLWFWSVLIRERGFYTEIQEKYNPAKADLDVVFIPVLDPPYNKIRAINPKSALNTFYALTSQWPEVRMIIDINKKHLINVDHPGIIYSNNIHHAFRYVQRSKIFIGSDTGTTHYAGALNHPQMILLYPNEQFAQNRVRWHRDVIAKKFNEPELLKIEVSSTPCCNPKNFQVIQLENHQIAIKKVMKAIDNF